MLAQVFLEITKNTRTLFFYIALHIQNSKTIFRIIFSEVTTPKPKTTTPKATIKPTTPKTTVKPTTQKPAGNSINRFTLCNLSSILFSNLELEKL